MTDRQATVEVGVAAARPDVHCHVRVGLCVNGTRVERGMRRSNFHRSDVRLLFPDIAWVG